MPAALDLPQLLARGERPFPSHPQVARYFPATAIEDARRRLSRAIERGNGPGLIIGTAGTGKSLLLQVLASQYQERFDVVLLACARICTRRALLQAILFEFGLPYRSRDEGQLRLSLLDQLLSTAQSPAGLLLLVDEAQSLSVPLLDELRVLTNLVGGNGPRVQLVLAGSTLLEENFACPELESFSQRLAARTYLTPLNRQETIQFVRAQIAASGGGPDDVFSNEALDAIFDATDGIPRLVNQLCDRTLVVAEAEHRRQISREVVQAAWSDLQQLPAPWSPPASASPPATSIASPVIEFGNLNDGNPIDELPGDLACAEMESSELVDAVKPDVTPCPAKIPACIAESPSASCQSRPEGNDPFAEEFAEEEIVLDTFAAWDDVITSTTPRVKNARDCGFATRVSNAMAAVESPPARAERTFDETTGHHHAVAHKVLPTEDAEAIPAVPHREAIVQRRGTARLAPADQHADDVSWMNRTTRSDDSDPSWPPIRLAVVEDAPPLRPIPLIMPQKGIAMTDTAAFDPVMPEKTDLSLKTTTRLDRSSRPRPANFEDMTSTPDECCEFEEAEETDCDSGELALDEEPILMIEEDANEPPRTQPSVRREDYRHLFSRLRSG